MLDDFLDWLRTNTKWRSTSLRADLTMIKYLDSLPRSHSLRIRQLGSETTLTHEKSPAVRGSLTVPSVSMHLQGALLDYTLERTIGMRGEAKTVQDQLL